MIPARTSSAVIQCVRCRVAVPVHLIGLPCRCPSPQCPLRPWGASCCEGEQAQAEAAEENAA